MRENEVKNCSLVYPERKRSINIIKKFGYSKNFSYICINDRICQRN